MAKYRSALPQLSDRIFLTDGGLETTLVFHGGVELPCFASFHILGSEDGLARLRGYYRRYLDIATARRLGFILDSPTWRASADWGRRLGYGEKDLAAVNRRAIDLMLELRRAYEREGAPIVISGCVGPRGDGYRADDRMTASQAEEYHAIQIGTFAETEADMIGAMTITYADEAIGITRAAAAANMPVSISFTVETDGRLPSGETLREAIDAVDDATGGSAVYFMINCAHPTHFEGILDQDEPWLGRLRGIRANASARSHAELDAATELDAGDPVDLGRRYRDLRNRFRNLTVLGGCCGTDHRHLEQICLFCAPAG